MSVVTDLQNNAINYASANAAMMDEFARQASSLAWSELTWSSEWSAPQAVPYPYIGIGYAPTTGGLPDITAERPLRPKLNDIVPPTLDDIPGFLAVEPVINIPASPDASLPGAPGAAPEFLVPAIPDEPTLVFPDAPTFQNIALPDFPVVEYPSFSSTLPVDDLVAPSEVFAYIEPTYESALLDELKQKLMYDLVNGGYGIETEDELRLWERAREREVVNSELAIQDISRQMAARGFQIPPGVMNTLTSEAHDAAREKNSSVSRDIMIKKADLFVQNRQFTMKLTQEVEQMLITAFGYMAERLLNAAKATVELSIAVFNARVARYNVQLETYRVAAATYTELIRAALAKIEAYKAQVEGARLSAEVQRVHADIYKTQIDGINALVNVYRTQVEASKTLAEIEKLKLDGFKTSVDAYLAQVQAKTAEFGMFESQIKGETAKINVYQAQVQAYATNVSAYKTKADIAEITVRAQVLENQSALDAYRSDIARYQAELNASQAELQLAVTRYDSDIKAFKVYADAKIAESQQRVEAGKANADIAVAHANVIATNTIHGAQVLAQKAAAGASTMASVASTYGQASASAISAATGIATVNE